MPSRTGKSPKADPLDSSPEPVSTFPFARYTSVVGVHTSLLAFSTLLLPGTSLSSFAPWESSNTTQEAEEQRSRDISHLLTESPLRTVAWICVGAFIVQSWWAGWVRQWSLEVQEQKKDQAGATQKKFERQEWKKQRVGRLVVFLSTKADFTSVPYLIDEFTNIWETAYDITDAAAFDCQVNRTNGDTSTQMYLINHFLDKMVAGFPAPDPSRADKTNAVSGDSSLGLQVQTCSAQHGRNPNFMLVDFYEYGGGSVFQVAANANGVTYSPATPVPSPKTAASSTSSGSSPGSSAVVTASPNGALEVRVVPGHFAAALAAGGMVVGALTLF